MQKSEYEFLKDLGEGNDGMTKIVSKCNKKFCLKIIPLSKKKLNDKKRAFKEVEALKKLRNHPNIIHFEESFICKQNNKKYICIVLELFGEFNLESFLKRQNNKLSEKKVRKIIKQLIKALIYCHCKGIIHRDIKLQNIVIDPSTFCIKLIDFGLCEMGKKEELKNLNKVCGTPFYVAPEVFEGHYNGFKSDVWSVGVLLYRLICGKFPFGEESLEIVDLFLSVKNENFTVSEDFSDNLLEVLNAMMEKNPEKRKSFDEILKFKWFNEKKSNFELAKSFDSLCILHSTPIYLKKRFKSVSCI